MEAKPNPKRESPGTSHTAVLKACARVVVELKKDKGRLG